MELDILSPDVELWIDGDLTTLILIVFIYAQFIGALRTEYTRQITSTAQRLEVAYEEGGRNALVSAIELTLSDRIDADREIYLLLDEHGRKIAGNLDESLPLDSRIPKSTKPTSSTMPYPLAGI